MTHRLAVLGGSSAAEPLEVVGLDLAPVLTSPRGAFPRRVRVLLAPADPTDPFLRRADPAAWLCVALEGRLLPQLADGRREAIALGHMPGQNGGGAIVYRARGRQWPRRRRA
jgi:hypothetical protein